MSLLCELGRHRPRGIPRWNDGLYFARCERCGRDLVRTAFDGWHVPRGYKVVWSDRPPAGRPEVALVRHESGGTPVELSPASETAPEAEPVARPRTTEDPPGAPTPSLPIGRDAPEAPPEPIAAAEPSPARTPVPDGGSQAGRLPIQDVLAHLNALEAADRLRDPEPAPAEVPARPRRLAWDFMDEDSSHDAPASDSDRGATSGNASAGEALPPVVREAGIASPTPGTSGERRRRIRSALRNFWSGPAEPKPLLVAGLALALAVAVALALYSAGYPAPGSMPSQDEASAESDGGAASEGAGKADPFAASAPYVSSGQSETAEGQQASPGAASDEVAYVSASLLVCRAAPDPRAPRVRNLVRGREVRVLGYNGAWASLAYRGGQCWAQAQYLSPVPPL